MLRFMTLGASGTDILDAVERVSFSNRKIALDLPLDVRDAVLRQPRQVDVAGVVV
ncbi:MAG: hypothetical protein JWQ07_4328 [Ramlibacter sp.]|nr:hypothetical protein [Ramlibacter sp.]